MKPKLPVKYEELTAPEFAQAVKLADGVCVLPIGILEKHGPHLPLGTDMLDAREIALRAVSKEYSIVFPEYYFGQIYEAKHQPGTIAYSHELVWNLLQENYQREKNKPWLDPDLADADEVLVALLASPFFLLFLKSFFGFL